MAFTGVFALFLAIQAHATEPVHTGWFSDVAVDGYDVVAYFTEGEAVEGSAEFSTQWRDAEWRFANQAHLDRFLEQPARYAPAYGGFCAYAVAQGTTAAGDPHHWTIHEDRLYLNYDAETQAKWEADREAHIAAADRNWPGVAQ
ncbi:hypothetical protein H0Z60_17410 [Ectothiorhodospiraceae bacterium WFHF3C12]|nr:hypothetical protein [Ectothiorhodospiraceae bacterium WFHF3C12]